MQEQHKGDCILVHGSGDIVVMAGRAWLWKYGVSGDCVCSQEAESGDSQCSVHFLLSPLYSPGLKSTDGAVHV